MPRAGIGDGHQLDVLARADGDDLVARAELGVLTATGCLELVLRGKAANGVLEVGNAIDDVVDAHRPQRNLVHWRARSLTVRATRVRPPRPASPHARPQP